MYILSCTLSVCNYRGNVCLSLLLIFKLNVVWVFCSFFFSLWYWRASAACMHGLLLSPEIALLSPSEVSAVKRPPWGLHFSFLCSESGFKSWLCHAFPWLSTFSQVVSTVVSLPLSLAHNSYYSHDCTPITHTSWALVQRRGKTIKWKDLYSGVKHSATTKRAVLCPYTHLWVGLVITEHLIILKILLPDWWWMGRQKGGGLTRWEHQYFWQFPQK